MANQNLSQFGENTSVSDADYTFVWDSAASISKKVSRNSWLNSGTLTSDAPVTISQTWNNAAVAFTGLKVNAVSTASDPTSKLLDLQLNGVSKLSVTKAGTINFGEVQANFDPYISRVANGTLAVSLYGFNQTHVSMGYAGGGNSLPGFSVSSGGQFAWSSSSTNSEAARDTILLRDGAPNTLALRNGANAQTFNVYGTWTTAITNFERLAIKYNATDVAYQIAAEKGTTNGDYRPLQLWTGGASRLHVSTAGNVGIGTTSPSSKLHVEGMVSAGTSGSGYQLTNGTTRVSGWGANQGASIGGLGLSSSFVVGWSSGVDGGNFGTLDTILVRDEAYHLALRNGTNGQKFSVYGTYPGAAWERFTITAPTSGNVLLGTYKGTGGIARGLEFQTDGVTRMTLGTTEITTTLPFTSSGLGKFVGVQLGTSGSSRLVSPGYGIATFLDSDGTGNFTKLNLAGNTDSFPSLKRSTTRIQAVLATTDTTFTNIQGKLTTDTDFTATVVTPTGFLTLYDAQGNAYKVPCVPA